jgi:esterase
MKLFYREYGHGPPLIILHGLYGSSDNWMSIAKKLGDYFTCYLPDQRNHGLSPHSNVHNYKSMRDDLAELVDYLHLDKFFLAGHSMGGKTAVFFAMKWPEKLHGLLVADISPFVAGNTYNKSSEQHLAILNAILAVDLSGLSSRKEAESVMASLIRSAKIRSFILKNLQRTSDNTFRWKINAAALLENLNNIMEGIDRPDSKSQQITGFPVFFLKGEDSDYLPESDFRDIQRLFPAAELIKVPNAGHWIHADRPDAVIKNLLNFITYY